MKYYNKPMKITLKKGTIVIIYVKQEHKLVFLNLTTIKAVITVKRLKTRTIFINNCRQAIYLSNKNKYI